jgi:hypothetical protein
MKDSNSETSAQIVIIEARISDVGGEDNCGAAERRTLEHTRFYSCMRHVEKDARQTSVLMMTAIPMLNRSFFIAAILRCRPRKRFRSPSAKFLHASEMPITRVELLRSVADGAA